MNILPKKRWHVRTKENIARVRKDEAEAAAKEKEEQTRIENADREARLNVLKLKAKQKLEENFAYIEAAAPGTLAETNLEHVNLNSTEETKPEHVNLFSDLEHTTTRTNKEHDLEVKNKKEEYEKQIGYLTYLGQDTNEALGKKNWYEVLPQAGRSDVKETYIKLELRDADGKPRLSAPDVKNGEISWKAKQALDPIKAFRHLHSKIGRSAASVTKNQKKEAIASQLEFTEQKRHKKRHKNHKGSREEAEKAEKLRKLREVRLRREEGERRRARALLAAASGVADPPATAPRDAPAKVKPKYNSQFNPELARQNYM